MKEGRLHIHLLHLKEAKPSEMPVGTAAEPRLLTGAAMRHTHTHTRTLLSPPSLLLYASAFLSSCLSVKTLVFHHLGLGSFFYRGPSSRRSWRVVACTVIVPYLRSASLISLLLCARFLFLPPPPLPCPPSRLLSAGFYSSAFAHKKVIQSVGLPRPSPRSDRRRR